MTSRRRSDPMPVKYWSSAGLLLTCWCNARCASCYVCAGPERAEWMDVEFALKIWREFRSACPHGCRIHVAGGEPFGDWPRLLALCERAAADGLGLLEQVETNAFWATDEGVVRDRIRALGAAGMKILVISADPYHQQYVPIERPRLAARVAAETLGDARVRVRWRDWLEAGFDTGDMDESRRMEVFARYAAEGRDRLNGRAADRLAPLLPLQPVEALAGRPCREPLLRSRHVHVNPCGRVMPGVCAGIVLGVAGTSGIADIRRRLESDHADRPILGVLARKGPAGLLEHAEAAGYRVRPGYAGKCHLCWDIRRFLCSAGLNTDELGPAWMYVPET